MSSLSYTGEQLFWLGMVYVVAFLVPAVLMWRRARRDGDAPLTWGLLVAITSGLGWIEYRKHRSILARRRARAEKAARQAASMPPTRE